MDTSEQTERSVIMKIFCGTDIIEIERIKKSIEDIGKHFLEKVYTEKEIAYCESKNSQKYAISWKDIEVENNKQGKPCIHLKGIDNDLFESIDISISHCKNYAVAYVVILQKGEN